MEDLKEKKKVHRKHKRRPQYLLQDYQRRQRQFVWLETHIWHAKRMKMGNLWGYKIAQRCNDKSWKRSYKFASFGCNIHDASYCAIIEIQGTEEGIISLLKGMTNPSGLSVASLLYNKENSCYQNSEIYHFF